MNQSQSLPEIIAANPNDIHGRIFRYCWRVTFESPEYPELARHEFVTAADDASDAFDEVVDCISKHLPDWHDMIFLPNERAAGADPETIELVGNFGRPLRPEISRGVRLRTLTRDAAIDLIGPLTD